MRKQECEARAFECSYSNLMNILVDAKQDAVIPAKQDAVVS